VVVHRIQRSLNGASIDVSYGRLVAARPPDERQKDMKSITDTDRCGLRRGAPRLVRRGTATLAAVATVASFGIVVPRQGSAYAAGHKQASVASSLPGALRFDRPQYALPGCVSATLFGVGTSGPAPNILFADLGTKDSETVPLVLGSGGTWVTSSCVPIAAGTAQSGDGQIEAQSGDVVFAHAQVAGADVAIGAFTTAGAAPTPGKVKVKVGFTVPKHLRNAPLGPTAGLRSGPTTAYMAQDAVLVADSEPGDLSGFLARYGGVDLGAVTIGAGPAGAGMTYHTVQINPSVFDATGFASQLGRLHPAAATLVASSMAAEQLLALITTEQTAGLSIWPDLIATPQDAPLSNEGNGSSLFSNEWFNPGATDGSQAVRGGEAMALMHVMKVAPATSVAVIDGGFAGPADFGGAFTAPDYQAPGGIYGNIPQCSSDALGSLTCAANVAQGSNPIQCTGGFSCPWHGYEMATTAAGGFDNGWGGTAGIGGQTASLRLYKLAVTYTLPLASSINNAATSGARVISISSGVPCVIGFVDLCDGATRTLLTVACVASLGLDPVSCGALAVAATFDAIGNAVNFAETNNVAIFAAAGNNPKQDPGAIKLFPCDVTPVVCVGGLSGSGSASAAPIRNTALSTGTRIDIWAPGNNVVVPPMPGQPNPTSIGGTSPATAFMAGVGSIALTIDPSLTSAQLRALLHSTACKTGNTARIAGPACTPSSDPNVDSSNVNNGGYTDVLEVVRQAWAADAQPSLGTCTGGFGEVTPPTGDTAATAQDLGNVTAALSGTLFAQHGFDRAITDLDVAAPTDTTFLKFGLVGSIPGVKAINVKASITVPDPALGDLQVSFVKITTLGIGPPLVTPVAASASQDSSSGTAFVTAALVIGKEYALQVSSVGPQPPNTNCYTDLQFDSLRDAPNPPPHEPWLETGSAEVQPGLPGPFTTAQVPLTLTGPLPYPCTVNYGFAGGTAVPGFDYQPIPGSLVIPPGQVSTTIPVSVTGQPANPSPVNVVVTITGATCPVFVPRGDLIIDTPPMIPPLQPDIQIGNASVWEGDSGPNMAAVTITLDRPAGAATTVNVTTSDGTATAGSDYLAVNTVVTIPAGGVSAIVQIPIIPNTIPQFDRSFSVSLSAPSAPIVLGPHSTGTVYIADDDPTP
jgi:Subtilase family/Calx-beta domain